MLRRSFLSGASIVALLGRAYAVGPSGSVTADWPLPGPGGADGVGPASLSNGPSLDLNFLGGPDARVTTTRAAGGATYFDATGTLQLASANTQRIDYGPSPGGVTNWIRNSTGVGSTPGVTGSGGVAPTNWVVNQPGSGITYTIGGTGIEGGVPYVDIAVSGTATGAIAGTNGFAQFEANNQIVAFTGQTWTGSVYLRIVSGTFGGSLQLDMDERTSAGANVATNFVLVTPTSAALASQRFTLTTTLSGGTTTAFVMPNLRYGFANGAVLNFTLRIGGAQAERGSVANAYVPTSGTAVNAGAVPLGLLVEEARANSIRNPRSEGSTTGTVGSGGVLPTYWAQSNGTGLATAVQGAGYENGLPYVDLRFFGTATASQINNWIETPIAIVGSTQYTASIYLRLVGGSLTNVTGFTVLGGDGTNVLTLNLVAPTSAPLATQRQSGNYTSAAGATSIIHFNMQMNCAAGAVDCTIRFGPAQWEQGAFATSPILPAVAAPAATTRAVDLVTMAAGSWFSSGASTLAASGIFGNTTATAVLASLNDGSAANRVRLGRLATSAVFGDSTSASAASTFLGGGANTPPAVAKLAYRYDSTTNSAAANGASIGSGGAALPSGINVLTIGSGAAAAQYADAWVQRIRYWPRALADAELQQVTT